MVVFTGDIFVGSGAGLAGPSLGGEGVGWLLGEEGWAVGGSSALVEGAVNAVGGRASVVVV